MAITKEKIFAVADDLDAKGQNPTLAAVRKALGSGSFTTISEAMTEWRARKAAATAPVREQTPEAVSNKLVELGADLWAVALDLANNRLSAEREALEVARTDMAAKQQETVELADQLTVDLDDAKDRNEALDAELTAAKAEIAKLVAELAATSERAATAEARASELRAELDRAHSDAETARAENEAALSRHREATAAAREEAATLRGRVEALEALITQSGRKGGGKKT